MPSKSYLSLLVLGLAASAVSPVRCAEPQKIEDQGHASSAPVSGPRHRTRGPGEAHGDLTPLGYGVLGFALALSLWAIFDRNSDDNRRRAIQPTSPQPNNPPPEERDLGHDGPISRRDQRTSSSPDLLSHADLAEELILFSRMLDKLD